MPCSGIILEPATLPSSTIKTCSAISISITYSTIKAYIFSPITAVPIITAIYKSPVSGSPKKSDLRRSYPHTGYPIISIRTICPITRRP
jgi:hypothetical protein